MTFRQRLTTASALAVALAIAVSSGVFYAAVRSQLRGQVDVSLRDRASEVESRFTGNPLPPENNEPMPPWVGSASETVVFWELRAPSGDLFWPQFAPHLAIPLAAPSTQPVLRDQTVNGTDYRTYTVPVGSGSYFIFARPLSEVNAALRRLALLLVGIAAIGIGTAIAIGAFVTRTVVGPVTRLTETAERISATGDLSHRIDVPPAADELSRLARTFNTMLDSLEESVSSQRRLVADASHELRTPITSVRTNIDLLVSGRVQDPAELERLVADVRSQLEELSTLVADLVDLARGGEPLAVEQPVQLDTVTEDAVDRARRLFPSVEFCADVQPTVVSGDPSLLARAVSNLLENAAKYGGDGGVDVEVRDGIVSVRDHGPGFRQEDLPHVFDRFYRAPGARGMPGSGLGLAIVRQVTEAHHGRVVAENAEDGGAVVRLELPA
ncbi:MAG: HAMP domain-containing sensor histidine kinase [Actinomycetota bacterium]